MRALARWSTLLLLAGCGLADKGAEAGCTPTPEIPYDGIDQDCDGADTIDVDRDAWNGDAAGGEDCDDTHAGIHPLAPEIPYDGIDQDCDGADLADVDGDGVDGTAAGGTDCRDHQATVHPGAGETPYDGIDQDCDGVDLTDVDGDGQDATVVGGRDCLDTEPTVYLGAPEVPYDGIDQDCDGHDLTDVDGDGHDAVAAGGWDCDDTDPRIHDGAIDLPCDGIDQDCVGGDLTDGDGDGHANQMVGGDDCDDRDATIHPNAAEIEDDGIDQDCDGADALAPPPPHTTITPTPDATFAGAPRLGLSSTSVSDLDGDGVPELAVSSLDTVYLLPGSARGAVDVSAAVGSVQLGGDGRHVIFNPIQRIGDVDGDGLADLLTGSGQRREVEVFAATTGIATTPLLTASDLDCFGATFASLGDVTGDGVPDVAVGEPGTDGGGRYAQGEIFVFSGADRGTDGAADAWLNAFGRHTATQELGRALAAGDFDGDGVDDLVIGEEGGRHVDLGRVWVVTDLTAGVDAIEDNGTLIVNSVSGWIGASVAFAGDADGDGQDDVLLGTPSSDGMIFLMTDLGARHRDVRSAAAVFVGSAEDESFGNPIAGDLDGDGVPDVVATEYGGNSSRGSYTDRPATAYVYRGPFSGTITTSDAAAVIVDDNPVLDTWVSLSVSLPGDLDGDGYGELLVGDAYFRPTTGAAWLYSGLLGR